MPNFNGNDDIGPTHTLWINIGDEGGEALLYDGTFEVSDLQGGMNTPIASTGLPGNRTFTSWEEQAEEIAKFLQDVDRLIPQGTNVHVIDEDSVREKSFEEIYRILEDSHQMIHSFMDQGTDIYDEDAYDALMEIWNS